MNALYEKSQVAKKYLSFIDKMCVKIFGKAYFYKKWFGFLIVKHVFVYM